VNRVPERKWAGVQPESERDERGGGRLHETCGDRPKVIQGRENNQRSEREKCLKDGCQV